LLYGIAADGPPSDGPDPMRNPANPGVTSRQDDSTEDSNDGVPALALARAALALIDVDVVRARVILACLVEALAKASVDARDK
jgi:hypothetical protein